MAEGEKTMDGMIGQQLSFTDATKASIDAKIEGRPTAWIDERTVDLREIYSNSRNFYACSDIEQLAQSIKCFGLMENLTAVEKPNGQGQKYRIVAGERRWRALKMLVEEGHPEFYKVSCTIIAGDSLDDDQEMMRLIAANQYRQKTFREQSEEIRQVKQILQKEESAEGGRLRDAVSRMTGLSGTKIAQIEAIDHNLIGAFRDALKSGDITFSAAYELSGLPSEEQAKLYGDHMMGQQLSVQQIRELKAELAQAKKEMDGQMDISDFLQDEEEEQETAEGTLQEATEDIKPAEGDLQPAEGAEPDLYAENMEPTDEEVADAWSQVKIRIQISEDTTKTGLREQLRRHLGSSWRGFTTGTCEKTWHVDCDPVAIRIGAVSPDGRHVDRKKLTWNQFVNRVIALGLFEPAPELVDAHPQAQESLCYSCSNYELCPQKQTNVTKCDSFADRKEAQKTEEQRYNEEQDRIDRETKQKLQKMQEDAAEEKPVPAGRSWRTVRVSETFLDNVISRKVPYMIMRRDLMPYRTGDIMLLIGMKDGVHTGKKVEVRVTCVDTSHTSSGIVEGYAVLGIMPADEKEDKA